MRERPRIGEGEVPRRPLARGDRDMIADVV